MWGRTMTWDMSLHQTGNQCGKTQRKSGIFKVVFLISFRVFSCLNRLFCFHLFGDHVCMQSRKKTLPYLFQYWEYRRVRFMSLPKNQSDSLLWAFRWKMFNKPPGITPFLLHQRVCLRPPGSLWFYFLKSSSRRWNGALSRDRKGLMIGGTVPSEPWDSMGILSVLVKDKRGQWEWRKRKTRFWGSTYWKHGQPTASTTAFFWSWLSFAVLLKFHKYISATHHKGK